MTPFKKRQIQIFLKLKAQEIWKPLRVILYGSGGIGGGIAACFGVAYGISWILNDPILQEPWADIFWIHVVVGFMIIVIASGARASVYFLQDVTRKWLKSNWETAFAQAKQEENLKLNPEEDNDPK